MELRPRKRLKMVEEIVPAPNPRVSNPQTPEENVRAEELKQKLFTNHVVWREVSRYLSPVDIKTCRHVSTLFNEMTLSTSKIKKQTRLTIDETVLTGGDVEERLHCLNFNSYLVKPIVVTKDGRKKTDKEKLGWCSEEFYEQVCRNIIELEVQAAQTPDGGETLEFITDAHVIPSIQTILESATNLYRLRLIDMFTTNCRLIEMTPGVADRFANIVELEIVRLTQWNDAWKDFMESLEVLVPVVTKLRTFKANKLVKKKGFEYIWPFRHLFKILENNAGNLNSLDLSDALIWHKFGDVDISWPCDLRFTAMTKLKTYCSQIDALVMANFLFNHRNFVEELVLGLGGDLPTMLHQTVVTEMTKLKKLNISAKFLDIQTPIYWGFHHELQNVSDFSLQLTRTVTGRDSGEREYFDSLISLFPINIERLSLGGEVHHFLRPLHGFGGRRNDPNAADRCKLKEIFLNSPMFQDCDVKCIGRMFGGLQVLSFTDCSITDCGFSGLCDFVKHRQSECFFRELRSLTIRNCEISDYTLEKMHSANLKCLDIRGNWAVTSEGCLTVLRNHKHLEVFKCDEMKPFESEDARRALILKEFPRLQKWEVSPKSSARVPRTYFNWDDEGDAPASIEFRLRSRGDAFYRQAY